jgi:hypothetical protein
MAATTGVLIQLLLILFVFDIVRKIYIKPKDIKKDTTVNKDDNIPLNKKIKAKNIIEKNNINEITKTTIENEIYEDDEFVYAKNPEKRDDEEKESKNEKQEKQEKDEREKIEKKGKKQKILTIKYDKYLYQKNFEKIKKEIENNYTNIFVEGEEYPLPDNKKFFSRFTYITQIGVSFLLVFTKSLKQGLPFIPDSTIKTIDEYKWFIMLGNFLIHFWLNRYLSTSGAFEIIFIKSFFIQSLKLIRYLSI